MSQELDLYTILMNYAKKRQSPYIDIDSFLVFLEKYANHISQKQPQWKKWTSGVAAKFSGELLPLIETRKCELLDDNQCILLPDFHTELVESLFKDTDKTVGLPFPDAASLGMELPEEKYRIISSKGDMADYMKNPQDTAAPLIKLTFPDNVPYALVPATAIPRPLLDKALLKFSNFLRAQDNKSFFHRRLLPQMKGREGLLVNSLNMMEARPLDCILQIQTAADSTYYFWMLFCYTVKNELRKKKEFLSTDIAAFQSVHIIETFSVIFKEILTAKRKRDQALSFLKSTIDKPPYLYTMAEIFKFTDDSGQALLGQYTDEDLKSYILSLTTSPDTEEIPHLLIYRNKQGEQIFISKQKILPLCVRLLGEARIQVRKAIEHRWLHLLQEFRKEPAMTINEEFTQLLVKYTAQLVPTLIIILRDKRTFFVQYENGRSQADPASTRLYKPDGTLLPMETLLMINRKGCMAGARMMLPFWYFIPVLSRLFAFFARLTQGNKKELPPPVPSAEAVAQPQEKTVSREQSIKATAAQLIEKLSDTSKSLDASMSDLEKKWHTLLDGEQKQHLITDIKSLIRRRLQQTLRLKLSQKISMEAIESLAVSLYEKDPTLNHLGDEDSITTYIKLYCAKLMQTTKF
ncbi:MAG: hypothetical protein LBH70_03000 [Spirochaetaceae bacterium]|jgi:hypothetical protein|nr:hypothetical protein [Spirochaetaceae bacterium]